MSTTGVGSKSSLYIKDVVPGVAFSDDTFTHQSMQNLWDSRGASDVLIHAVYMTTAVPFLIGPLSVKRLWNIVAHGASEGDFIRVNNGAAISAEVTVLTVIDANNLVVACELPVSVGDEVFVLKPVTPTYNQDGSLNVSSAPISFIKNLVTTQVEEDTVTPANNEPLPSKLFFQKDGITYPVNKDTATPSNTAAIPVEIVGASGQVINITAGDINVQTSDMGASFDSMRIGDGTGNYIGVNASAEGKVINATANTKLDNLLTELQLKADLTETQPVNEGDTSATGSITILNSVPTGAATAGSAVEISTAGKSIVGLQVSGAFTGTLAIAYTLNNTLWVVMTGSLIRSAADGSIQTTIGNSGGIFNINTAGVLKIRVYGVSAITGSASINMFASKAASLVSDAFLGTTMTAMSTKLPATLGTKADAASLAVTQSTEDKARQGDVTETAPASDTASSGQNGRLQRIAQRITSLIALFPTALGQGTMATSMKVVLPSDQSAIPVTMAAVPTGGSTAALQTSGNASLTSIDGKLPTTLGQKTSAASLAVVLASDTAVIPVAQGAIGSFYAEITNLTTTNQFILSGVTCKKIYIQADDTNTANVRVKITNSATAATTASGWQLQPGRSDVFEMGGSSLNCSVGIIAESGTNQKVYVQYGN